MVPLARIAQKLATGMGVALVLALPAAGVDYYVGQNGQTPAPPYTAWSSAASNIQDAVNEASDGDTIWVDEGVYRTPTNAVDIGAYEWFPEGTVLTIR
jgi:hypothetical protein